MDGMFLDLQEFSFCQLAGFVQYLLRDHHLADIVQEPGHAGIPDLLFVQFQFSCECNHQGAHRNGMHVGVFILVLQARQTDQCIGITHH